MRTNKKLRKVRDVKIYKREHPGPFKEWLSKPPGDRELVILIGPKLIEVDGELVEADTAETVAEKCRHARTVMDAALKTFGQK
jgi:hypothetical protein